MTKKYSKTNPSVAAATIGLTSIYVQLNTQEHNFWGQNIKPLLETTTPYQNISSSVTALLPV